MLHPNLQSDLFKHKLDESGCSPHQTSILFEEGLLSFNPEGKEEYEGFEIEELKFLKSLYFDAGISVGVVKAMLGKLEKPYSYSFEKIYWDFGIRGWKSIPQDAKSYINDNLKDIIFDNFDDFLKVIGKDDIEELSNIKTLITNRFKLIK